MHAVREGSLDSVTCLLDAGATLATTDKRGLNALQLSIIHQRVEITEILLQAGADASTGTTQGELGEIPIPPLHLAAAYAKETAIFDLLYQAGASDKDGKALCVAAENCNENAVKFFLRKAPNTARALSVLNNPVCSCVKGVDISVSASVRIMRRLLDEGATAEFPPGEQMGVWTGDVTASKPRVVNSVLEIVDTMIVTGEVIGYSLGKADMKAKALERMRRLLLQVDAVHALSWLWNASNETPLDADTAGDAAGDAAATATAATLRQLALVRRRSQKKPTHRVILRALFRYLVLSVGRSVLCYFVCKSFHFSTRMVLSVWHRSCVTGTTKPSWKEHLSEKTCRKCARGLNVDPNDRPLTVNEGFAELLH